MPDTLRGDLRGTLRSEVSDTLTAEVSNEGERGSLTS
jgi:protein required for attachment to host cells